MLEENIKKIEYLGKSLAFKEESTSPKQFYWRYNKLYPFSLSNPTPNGVNEGDACVRLHPRGVWRSPTKADFINLVNSSTAINSPTSSLDFDRYWDGVSTTTSTSNNHLVIRIGTGQESATNRFLYLNAIGFYFGDSQNRGTSAQNDHFGIEINILNPPYLGNWGFNVYSSVAGMAL